MNDASHVQGRSFAVTGGTGLIGRALVEELCRLGARQVVVLARHASSMTSSSGTVKPVDAEITDSTAVASAVAGADVVFHLAAEKRLDVCERQPGAAIKTNVLGTMVVLDVLRQMDRTARIVVASSTKAVQPTSAYGITKAAVEHLTTEGYSDQSRRHVAVRLPAISADGVLTKWRRSVATDGRIEITDPNMTRFVLTQTAAVSSLLRAAAIEEGCCVLAPRARSYRLGDLAESFARERGCVIRTIGSRPGESVHEYLVGEYEAVYAEVLGTGDYLITPGRRRTGTSPVCSADSERISSDDLAAMFGIGEHV